MAYNPNVIFPETLSQGSSHGIGFDTNVLSLENGTEYKVPRMQAWGRRKYNVARNKITRAQVNEIIKFYTLRGGSRDSFKFKDWNDYASTSVGYIDETNAITPFDMSMQLVSGTTYQVVKTISDDGGSVTRPIEKIKASTFRCAVNGTEVFSPANFTLNAETGRVVFNSGLGAIASATAGFEFYVVVSFAPESDENLEALLSAVQSNGSIPSIHLIEDVSRTSVTQYVFHGGSYAVTVPASSTYSASMLNGSFQAVTFGAASTSHVRLPAIDVLPTGYIMSIFAVAAPGSNTIKTNDDATLVTVTAGKVYECYVYVTTSGVKTWAVVG